MQFVLSDGVYKVARITGPTHNLLGVCIVDELVDIEVIELPMKGSDTEKVTPKEVLYQVVSGLKEVNEHLGKSYFVSKIFFVPSDSPSDSVYSFLTSELIKRIDSKQEFLVV